VFTFIFLRIIVLPFPKVNKVVCEASRGLFATAELLEKHTTKLFTVGLPETTFKGYS